MRVFDYAKEILEFAIMGNGARRAGEIDFLRIGTRHLAHIPQPQSFIGIPKDEAGHLVDKLAEHHHPPPWGSGH